MPNTGLSGLSALASLSGLQDDQAFATPEERSGGPADPYHGHWGEQAHPYPWESSLTMSGSHGPYGPENQMLSDEFWFIEPAGTPDEDPNYDYNAPSLTKSHGSVHNVTNSGPVPGQADAIHQQIEQMQNHGSSLNSDKQMQHWDDPLNDQWQEIWNVTPGHTDIPKAPGAIGNNAFGVGVNDRPMNAYAKRNGFGLDSAHMHRRFATGSIPGNYMWMKPGGRPMIKSLPGPARPAIGKDSPFEGDDLGMSFSYEGAILQNTPQAYTPPPSPYLATPTPTYDNPLGTDAVDWW